LVLLTTLALLTTLPALALRRLLLLLSARPRPRAFCPRPSRVPAAAVGVSGLLLGLRPCLLGRRLLPRLRTTRLRIGALLARSYAVSAWPLLGLVPATLRAPLLLPLRAAIAAFRTLLLLLTAISFLRSLLPRLTATLSARTLLGLVAVTVLGTLLLLLAAITTTGGPLAFIGVAIAILGTLTLVGVPVAILGALPIVGVPVAVLSALPIVGVAALGRTALLGSCSTWRIIT
jgi:hypothetical protein